MALVAKTTGPAKLHGIFSYKVRYIGWPCLALDLSGPALPSLSWLCSGCSCFALPCPNLPCARPCPVLPCPALPGPFRPFPAWPYPAGPSRHCTSLPGNLLSAARPCPSRLAQHCPALTGPAPPSPVLPYPAPPCPAPGLALPSLDLPGISGNDFCTFGIGNRKWPSLFPNFEIVNGNEKFKSQILGLGMGMKNSIPFF